MWDYRNLLGYKKVSQWANQKSKVGARGGAALVTGPRENSLSGSQFSHSHKLRLELN